VNTEKLSRKSHYYDRFGGKLGKAVKKKRKFGQVSRQKKNICPNASTCTKTSLNPNSAPYKNLPESNSPPGRSLIHILKLKRALQRYDAVKDFLVFCCVLWIDVEVAVSEELEFVLSLSILHVWLDEAIQDF
jgi:hypothetical protein